MSQSDMPSKEHEKLDYVEFPARDIPATKAFFEQVFNWQFTDYGPDYTAFGNQGLDGGFFKSDQHSSQANGGALLVFFSDKIEDTQSKVEQFGGAVTKPIFDFPGGRRFHFTEPSGNEFAVWAYPAE
ncbi:VOC family protein [Paraneptunicella aestuarii]|uniref:VOC family protein n=1 Tax=Paraneptunicella aestuarii TaxID=2831148 RepID=UPI001E3F377A|nr:VOC family protein [Paraneptunicella aestuarii]